MKGKQLTHFFLFFEIQQFSAEPAMTCACTRYVTWAFYDVTPYELIASGILHLIRIELRNREYALRQRALAANNIIFYSLGSMLSHAFYRFSERSLISNSFNR